jgi:enterochelin esterase family protein
MKFRSPLPFVFLLGAVTVQAQQPQLDQNRPMAAPVVSPEVNADRTIIFRISAPTATEVQLMLGNNKRYPMTKDDKGVWSVTVGPLDPNVYSYSYTIGGARVNSAQVEIPGDSTLTYAMRDVPHGAVVLHNYYSTVQKWRRRLRVYLPPQYFSEPSRRFPVLYLYMGGNEALWTDGLRANLILDNLIAENKAVPMIIVMPDNSINDGTGKAALYPPALDNLAVIDKETQVDIMPMIEHGYRVIADRNHRATAGFSFGGGVSFGMGMRHLNEFAYVGEFSTGTFGGADTPPPGHINYIAYEPDKIAPDMYKHLLDPATKPKVFFMSVGDRDPRSPFQKLAYEDFKKHGIDVIFKTYPGGHDEVASRGALADFVQLLFK